MFHKLKEAKKSDVFQPHLNKEVDYEGMVPHKEKIEKELLYRIG